MKVLYICSGNALTGISPIVRNQGESLIKAGIDLYYFPINGKGFHSYLKHVSILRKYSKKDGIDLYHAHYSLSAFVATLAGCRPLVVSLMGSDIKTNCLFKTIIRKLANYRWKKLIVKTSRMKSGVRVSNAIVLPNGVNLDYYLPLRTSNGKLDKKVILFAADPGRYVKNFKLADEACNLLDYNNIILKVVHSKPSNEVLNEINNASVLLLTSLWEGSPNIVKEAMASNCPVVATDVGDVRWLFGEEPGHFICGYDPGDVAEKLRLAIDFSDKFGRTNGRQRIIELGLDTDTVANKLISLYSETLERPI